MSLLLAVPAVMLLATGAYPVVTARGQARLAATDLVHRTRGCHYAGIVGRYLRETALGEAVHEVHLKPSKGLYLNLSIADWHKATGDSPGYVYFSLVDAPAFAAAINVNMIGRSAEEKVADPLAITVSGADLIAWGADRLFYRALDGTVALRGEYRGPARVTPSHHRRATPP
jgi:hypothetical protein